MASPPSRSMPASKVMRVRSDCFWKIMARILSLRALRYLSGCFLTSAALSSICPNSYTLRSRMDRKSFCIALLLGRGHDPRPGPVDQGGLEMGVLGDQDLPAARLDVFDGGPDLGPHRSRRELAVRQVPAGLVHGQDRGLALAGLAEIEEDPLDRRQDDEQVHLDLAREQARGVVLVDDGLDALEEAVAVDDDRDAPAAGGDDDAAGLDELADDAVVDDVDGLGRRHDLAVAPSGVLDHRPGLLAGELLGPGLRIEGADGLGRLGEGRVLLVDDDLG